jgi:hypothetical protein
VDVVHVPVPLQVLVVSCPLLQDDGAHWVPLAGKTHAPVPGLHPVAPQAPPMGEQAAVQQLPVPAVPQTPLVHWSFAVHVVPTPSLEMHAPPEQYVELLSQSASVVHCMRQAVALLHLTNPGQALVDVLHAPVPLQVLVVSCPLLQDGGAHWVPPAGKTHAPVLEPQPVAPQAPPMGEQAAVQQLPTLVVPQTPLVHWSGAVHAPPGGNLEAQLPAEQ